MVPADPQPTPAVSVEAYLAAERTADIKHQLWAGEVFAMAGASYVHNQIVANLARELGTRLRDRPCDVLPSDLKVFVPSKPGIVYPDLSIVCGEPDFHDGERDVVLNPTVVVEVLSDGTERFDRGEKFAGYRSLSSIRQVVLVSQHEPRVEVYTRETAGRWILEEATGDEVARLASVDCELPLPEVYLKVFERPSQ